MAGELPTAEEFVAGFAIDDDKRQAFLGLPKSQQDIVIAKGPLHGTRNPTAVLVSRLNKLPVSAEEAAAPEGLCRARVTTFKPHKGFGFFNTEEQGVIFVHVRNVVDGTIPQAGDLLSFDLKEVAQETAGSPPKYFAVNVRGGTGVATDTPNFGGKGKGKGFDAWNGCGPYSKGSSKGKMMAAMMAAMMCSGGDSAWKGTGKGWSGQDDAWMGDGKGSWSSKGDAWKGGGKGGW
eukprot:TRINITY_DN70229_c0_g1_i1.p1 TRINITY_DN70229_c0_g1~~TRINITY_DN70229_c0_g1_i1.p1  ORF type:complete len:248 (-),score=51.01 TRINITY_DN70229_c0_g1_i1:50-751(-)